MDNKNTPTHHEETHTQAALYYNHSNIASRNS